MSDRSRTRTYRWSHNRRRSTRLLVGLLAAMSLLAVSCGTDDDASDDEVETPSADTSAAVTETEDAAPEPDADEPAADEPAPDDSDAEEAPEPAPEPEETAPEVPAPSGTVRSAPLVSLITMDPHKFSGGGLSWLTPVYEPLFRIERGGDGSIQPVLATGFSVDGLDVTITLRDDVTFSDGEPFDAAAVTANLERGKAVGVRSEFAVIDSVSAAGPFTVVRHTGPARSGLHQRPGVGSGIHDQSCVLGRSRARPQPSRHGSPGCTTPQRAARARSTSTR